MSRHTKTLDLLRIYEARLSRQIEDLEEQRRTVQDAIVEISSPIRPVEDEPDNPGCVLPIGWGG